MRDRRRYLHWLFEAKKRFGLSVLNYMITSNHVHLLIKDTGPNVIADSMQLIAGRTAQEYNERKGRQGSPGHAVGVLQCQTIAPPLCVAGEEQRAIQKADFYVRSYAAI
jgi:REP element-mobilizing transposase RayT